MVQRILKKIYIVVFIVALFLPFLLAHKEENRIADGENRYYANVPKLFEENGQINTEYIQDFEAWIDDNARFRSLFREIKVTVLYKLFHYLDLENVRIGADLEFYDTGELAQNTMQGRNLMSEEALDIYEDNLYQLQSWLKEQNIDFYYLQCYHKITIFDERYPKGLVRYDTEYIGENTENYIVNKGRVNIVPLRELMETTAMENNIYYQYEDWCHWNDAGIFIGYEKLMQTIQQKHPEVEGLSMDDFNIDIQKAYKYVYGFPYPYEEEIPHYRIKDVKSVEKECVFNDRLLTKSFTHYFENPSRQKKILVINDSFIRMGMKDLLAENFEECLSMDLSNLPSVGWIVEEFKPDIVVLECVETNIPWVEGLLNNIECLDKTQEF